MDAITLTIAAGSITTPERAGEVASATVGCWWEAAAPQAAFGDFVTAHRRRIFGLLLGHIGDADEAEDLTQEVFVRAWRNRARFRPSAEAWPWLAKIAINVARDAHRRRRVRPESPIDDPVQCERPDPREAAAASEHLERVRQALQQLPERQREVMVLHAHGGMSPAEIAKVLGLRANNVRVNLHHGRQRLREILGEEEKR